MRFYKGWAIGGLLLMSGILITGCSDSSSTATSVPPAPEVSETSVPAIASSMASSPRSPVADSEEHGHKSGVHGGIMVSLGRDSYHAEAVFEKGGTLRLYTLGQDETRVIDIEQQTLKGFVKIEGESSAQPFTLEPQPQEGDAAGRTSQFVGALPQGLGGLSLEVTVPNIVISGERFRLGFKSTPEQHEEAMPSKLAADEERQLYIMPGGKYTAADIAANGGVTASVKFKGMKSSHDMFPKPGDKICPVTETKANPQFTWVVGGQSYEFCCPPCVDEFVKAAKETTEDLKPPTSYVKQ